MQLKYEKALLEEECILAYYSVDKYKYIAYVGVDDLYNLSDIIITRENELARTGGVLVNLEARRLILKHLQENLVKIVSEGLKSSFIFEFFTFSSYEILFKEHMPALRKEIGAIVLQRARSSISDRLRRSKILLLQALQDAKKTSN